MGTSSPVARRHGDPSPQAAPHSPEDLLARVSALWLGSTLALLLAGIGLNLAGGTGPANALWVAAAVVAFVPLTAQAVVSLVHRRLGVDLLALLSVAGTLAIAEYLAAAVLAVMVAGGRALESAAEHRAAGELTHLLSRTPTTAHLQVGGDVRTVPVAEVRLGDLVVVKPGEVVPVDGRVTGPSAVLDESALTGESTPVERAEGDDIRSGAVNAGGPIVIRAISTSETSTYAGIVRTVAQARRSKAPLIRLADRIAAVFLPVALAVAGATWLASGVFERAVAVLVVATPCPLILAAPVAVISGISRAARRGVIVKGGGALERLAQGTIVLLDKTGTLTSGRPVVQDLEVAPGRDPDDVLGWAASVDQMSPHVLAAAIVQHARDRSRAVDLPTDVHEEPGRGIRGKVDGHEVAVGRGSWVTGAPMPDWARRVRRRTSYEGLANVFVAVDGEIAGAFVLEDPVRPDSARTLRALRRAGIERIVMLTGDHVDVAETVGAAVGVDEVLAERSPAEKVTGVELQRSRGRTVMVGDGINDAPALAAADVGVVMGARGSTAASEAGDVVILSDRLERLVEGLVIAQRSRRIALQSAVAGMSLSAVAMSVAAVGLLAPIGGALVQEAIDVAVILYALRALGGPSAPVPDAGDVLLAERLTGEHATLIGPVRRIRTVAEQLDAQTPADRLAGALSVQRLLRERILPHEASDESSLYPVVARLIGGEDPTGPMSREHAEIVHLARLLDRLVEDAAQGGIGDADLPELRRLLLGIHTVLSLHFAQEDESYLSLLSRDQEPSGD